MKIWLVIGQTGEHSDFQDWIVCAYCFEQKAKNHAVKANKRAAELYKESQNYYDVKAGANEFDPGMKIDYTGTTYDYFWVELKDAPLELEAWIKIQQ